jgi:hypothetical protein
MVNNLFIIIEFYIGFTTIWRFSILGMWAEECARNDAKSGIRNLSSQASANK